jgi:hypothetical protein
MTPYMEFPEMVDSKMGIIFIGKATFLGFSKLWETAISARNWRGVLQLLAVLASQDALVHASQ